MLIAQDLIWFASDADRTGLNLVHLGCWLHRTYLFCLGCWLHRTWFCFASDADCTGLDFVLPRMLVGTRLNLNCQFFSSFFLLTWTYLWVPIQLCFDFITHVYLIGLTPLMPVWLRFEVLWRFWFIGIYLLSSRRSFWSFYQVREIGRASCRERV